MVYLISQVAVGVWGGRGLGAPRKSHSSGGGVGLRWESGGRWVGSIEGGSFVHQGPRILKGLWVGAFQSAGHVLGQQMVSFLGFVEKVFVDHIQLNSIQLL